jgi:regulator of sigma D
METEKLTDYEFCMHYIEDDNGFINPFLFNECRRRGLVSFIDRLKGTTEERKAQCYARLIKAKKVFGDDEIDYIAGKIELLEKLKQELNDFRITDVAGVIQILDEMRICAKDILDYFKKS